MPQSQEQRQAYYAQMGPLGKVRRRIRSLHVRMAEARRENNLEKLKRLEKQYKCLELHRKRLTMEQELKKINKEIEEMGPVENTEQYLS